MVLLPAVLVPTCDFALFGFLPGQVLILQRSEIIVPAIARRTCNPLGLRKSWRVDRHEDSIEYAVK